MRWRWDDSRKCDGILEDGKMTLLYRFSDGERKTTSGQQLVFISKAESFVHQGRAAAKASVQECAFPQSKIHHPTSVEIAILSSLTA